MHINELLGYELICKISDDLKNHSDYQEGEFKVIINKDESCEEGYNAIIKVNVEGQVEENVWDITVVLNNFSYGNWEIINKNKI